MIRLHLRHPRKNKTKTASEEKTKFCKQCLETSQSLSPDIAKGILGEISIQREPKELVKLDF